MGKTETEKCLTCNAPLKYNAKEDIFKCEYCGNVYKLEDLVKFKKQKPKKSKILNLSGYNCSNCGATIILGDNTASTSCVYCKSSAIIKSRLEGIYAPSKIITFKYTKEEAIKRFKELCHGRKLIPNDFDNINNIQDMEGLYVPFWLYNCTNNVDINMVCTKVTTWTNSKYINTKTDVYNVMGKGNLIFDKVPNDAASRFDDNIMHAIEPFDYSKLVPFNKAYLSGYISERYDVDAMKAYDSVKESIDNDSRNYLLKNVKGYSSKRISSYTGNIDLKDNEYVLLPVFVLNIKYKDKIYRFSMNGQTGKYVGEIPVDKVKLLKLMIISLVIIFLFVFLILILIGAVL